MFRIVAARGTTAALRASRPTMMYVPARMASFNSGSSWDSAKKDMKEVKKDVGNVVDSVKQAGKDWANNMASASATNAPHPYLAKDTPAATQAKGKAAEGVEWAKEKV